MLNNVYIKIKNYFLGNDFSKRADVFEKVRTVLFLNMLILFVALYIVGLANFIINGFWYLLFTRLIGLLIFIGAFIALKKTRSYLLPIKIFAFGILLLQIHGLVTTEGQLFYANLGFCFLNITLVFIFLNKYLKIFFFCFYLLFITVSLSVNFQLIAPLNLGFDFSQEQAFFAKNVVYTLFPYILLVHTLYALVTFEYRLKTDLISQIYFTEKQKDEINLANQSMTKSIMFASQIQKAFLPSFETAAGLIQDNFVLIKPKHELSGDFYWSVAVGDDFYLAVIDSSENNISGAILGSIYFDALDTIVKRQKIYSPSGIIAELNSFIQTKTDIHKLKEGIDISMVRVKTKHKKIHFVSEKNSLYVARKGKKVIDEYKSRAVLGERLKGNYHMVEVDYKKDDVFYLNSDGFANQFQGFDTDKFKESVLKAYLNTIKKEPLAVQKELLKAKLEEWKNGAVQTDDVCMIGVKL